MLRPAECSATIDHALPATSGMYYRTHTSLNCDASCSSLILKLLRAARQNARIQHFCVLLKVKGIDVVIRPTVGPNDEARRQEQTMNAELRQARKGPKEVIVHECIFRLVDFAQESMPTK